jgi:5-(carboxyamino)imidazole ribonucleotide synthase
VTASPDSAASLAATTGGTGSDVAKSQTPLNSIGLLGGGQLGRMLVHAAQAQGFAVTVLEPDPHSPAGAAANAHLCAAYTDPHALATLAQNCCAVTTEFENVPAQALRELALALPVSPPASAVEVCQHRALEKQCFAQAGVPCAPHAVLETAAQAAAPSLADLLPGLLKTARLGYDGKGQLPVATLADVASAWAELGGVVCVLEKKLPLQLEISVIVARSRDGHCVHLPVQQNLHRAGVLAVTQVPAPDVPPATAARAIAWAQALAQSLHYVGVLCVEFFVLADGSLVANEMAPRPHNSGHYSIDACDVSQFDLQLRTLVGWPLVAPRLHSPAVMLNLLGDLWFAKTAVATSPDWAQVLKLHGVHLHLYGKADARPGRKMGHLTVTAADAASARNTALQVAAVLGLPAF